MEVKLKKETVVISVGGSLIVPNRINTPFIKSFKKIIEKYVRKGWRFVIISGGGQTARNYQNVAKQFTALSKDDIDWIGINATWLNANFLRIIFDKKSHEKIFTDPTKKINFKEPILIAGGFRPGASTDYVAVLIVKKLKAHRLINLTNIDFVYTRDPRKYNNIDPIKDITWKAFQKLLPKKWDPGLHIPFDPVASREAQKIGLEVAVINGRNLKEFERYLDGKKFRGTLIHP